MGGRNWEPPASRLPEAMVSADLISGPVLVLTVKAPPAPPEQSTAVGPQVASWEFAAELVKTAKERHLPEIGRTMGEALLAGRRLKSLFSLQYSKHNFTAETRWLVKLRKAALISDMLCTPPWSWCPWLC